SECVAGHARAQGSTQLVQGPEEGVEHRRLRLVAAEHDPDLAEERRRELHRAESAGPHVGPGRERGRHRQSQPRLHQLLDRFRVAELHRRGRRRATPLKPVIDHTAQGRPPLEQDQGLLRELGRRGAAPRPPPAGRPDRHELVPVQRAHRQLALSHRQAHDPDVELVGHDRARDLGRVAGDHDQLRLRVARAESPQRGRQQIDAERRAGAEPDASGHDASELLDELEPALELPHRAPGVRQEELARLGRVGPLADTLEQRQPQLLLELSHLHADGRLRESKLARRAGEIPVARDRGERLQVRELDVHDGETKKYLIVTIKTIDFPDSGLWRIMRAWNRAPTPSSCSRRTAWTAPASTPDAGGSFAAAKSCPLPCPRSSAPADRVRVRAARESDLAQIAAIWNYEVLGTDATTDTEPRSLAAQQEWLARHTERYPVVVAAIAADAPERD